MSSQANSVDVSDEVKRLVSDIITKNNITEACEIKYSSGSQAGDGYASKTIAVDIINEEKQVTVLNLFLKCALNVGNTMPTVYLLYSNEIYFYNTIYPTYREFLESKSIRDGFRNVPICYGFNESKDTEVVALENLRKKEFTLFDRFTYMNDDHLQIVLKTFAKFHAVSFAMKDQRKEKHDEFCEKCPNFYVTEKIFAKMFSNATKDFLAKLDPIEDRDMLEKCNDVESKIYDQIVNIEDYISDYSIFVKGDCWANNMMMLYENDDREHPKDVMLVDWQCVMRASPVHDIQALFYTVSSKETISNYQYYLQIYHEELSRRIEELGSDPKVLYPFSVFEQEWKNYGIYALGFSLLIMKAMLCEPENAPAFEKHVDMEELEQMFGKMTDNQEEYMKRAKYVVQHIIDIGSL